MAEIHLSYGRDGFPVLVEFDRLRLRSGDTVVCTLPVGSPVEQLEKVGETLQALIDVRRLDDVKIIVLNAGISLLTLSDDDLALLGLARV